VDDVRLIAAARMGLARVARLPSNRLGIQQGVAVATALLPYLAVGIGAFLGANARFLVAGWAADRLGTAFPYGTLVINVSGSFAIGLFLTLIGGRFVTPPIVRLFIAVGFLGGYTTFSTYAFESLALLQARASVAALLNVVGSVILGLLAVVLGSIVGRLL
jgi:CrcB protein